MACECGKPEHECNGNCKCGGKCANVNKRALEIAVDQFHKWDDMVFKGKDGCPPLVNVELSAYTMGFFMREKGLLKLLFASNPKEDKATNTNIATILYDKDKLVGIAIEYGNNEKAYVSMDKLDKDRFFGLSDWQAKSGLHAAEMRTRIREYTGRDIGLIKCADLNGFFGGLHKVVENENTLEMLLEGVKFAANCVTYGHLTIHPEPKFFSYLRLLNKLTDTMDAKEYAEIFQTLNEAYYSCQRMVKKVNIHLPNPNFAMGLVLQNKDKKFAAVEICSEGGKIGFKDYGSLFPVIYEGQELKEAVKDAKRELEQSVSLGVSTEFLYNAMKSALTYSPLKLGYAVAKAAVKGELVIC